MIKRLAYKLNRSIKNTDFYNVMSRMYYLYIDLDKLLKYGTTDMFDEISIETTSVCNRKCSYCPVSKYDRGQHFMEMELFKKVIDELKSIGYKGDIVHHFYAEPLLDKRLEKFLEYEKNKLPNSKVRIYTNGDFLTKKRFKSLVSAGVDSFYVTLHMEKENPGFMKFYNSLSNKNQSKIILRRLYPESLLSSRGGLVEVKHKEIKKFCGFPSHNVVIDVHGNFVLCCEDYFGKNKWGNVKEESIMEIWNKKRFRKLRRDTMKGKFELDICKHCTNKDI